MCSYRSHCLTSRSMLSCYSRLVGPPGAGGSLATSPPLGKNVLSRFSGVASQVCEHEERSGCGGVKGGTGVGKSTEIDGDGREGEGGDCGKSGVGGSHCVHFTVQLYDLTVQDFDEDNVLRQGASATF